MRPGSAGQPRMAMDATAIAGGAPRRSARGVVRCARGPVRRDKTARFVAAGIGACDDAGVAACGRVRRRHGRVPSVGVSAQPAGHRLSSLDARRGWRVSTRLRDTGPVIDQPAAMRALGSRPLPKLGQPAAILSGCAPVRKTALSKLRLRGPGVTGIVRGPPGTRAVGPASDQPACSQHPGAFQHRIGQGNQQRIDFLQVADHVDMQRAGLAALCVAAA